MWVWWTRLEQVARTSWGPASPWDTDGAALNVFWYDAAILRRRVDLNFARSRGKTAGRDFTT